MEESTNNAFLRIARREDLSDDEISAIEQARNRYTEDWSHNNTPAMVFYLAPLDARARGRALVELVKQDIDLSWRSIKPVLVENYLQTWKELQEPAVTEELIAAECMARGTYARLPKQTELELRFPEFYQRIDLSRIESLAAEQRQSECFDHDGRFFVIRKLGEGGMGVVYEVLDRERQSRIALKTLSSTDVEALYRLKSEFRVLQSIVDERVAKYYELIADGDRWFFTMELIEGQDLVSAICPIPPASADEGSYETHSVLPEPQEAVDGTVTFQWQPSTSTQLPDDSPSIPFTVVDPVPWEESSLSELRRALSQLTRTIAWLHEQDILHRDLKPSNILYTPDRKVVVLDFGLAAQLRDMNATTPRDDSVDARESARSRFQGPRFQSTTVAGTALYMSPEQAAGKELGNASDWYSLGVIIYQLLTGQRPFEGRAADVMLRKQADDPPAPHELNPLVPIDLSELCIALLNRDPERRPQADEILHLLNEAKSDASQPIKQPIEPFVGRGREISTLARSYRESANQFTVAVVHGESGVGKSTLVDRFLRNLSENARPLILRGRCFEQESVPFKAVDNLIDELARWLTHQSESELNDLLPEDFALLSRVFPVLLRARASESLEHTETSIPDARELRRLAVRALRELLTRIARRHRLVLAIDDLQWGDVDSSLLLNELFGTVDAPRLLLILSFRSEYVRTSQCLTTLALIQSTTPTFARIEVHVGPLSVEETRKLAKHILGTDHPRADDCSRQIAREADGSPYFAFELARYYKDSSRVIPDSVATQGNPINHKTEVNTSTGTEHLAGVPLEEVLWQRFLALEAPERDLIALLAVAGRPVTLGQAGNAAGLHDSLQIVWASLRSQHLIKGFGPRLDGYIETFHDRIRETIVARLSNEQRRMRHSQLAHTLVHDDESDPETIAVHFEGCGEYIRAGEYFAKAAEAAAESLAFSRAVELYQRSLDLRPLEGEPRRRLRLAAADALANAGMGAQAAEVYQEVARGAKNVEEATGWEQAAATQYCISGHIDRGRELFRRVLRRRGIRLFTRPWQALASWLWWRARLKLRGLKPQPSHLLNPQLLAKVDTLWAVSAGLSVVDTLGIAALQSRGLLMALEAGDPYRVSRALSLEAIFVGLQGQDPAAAETLRAQAHEIASSLKHPHALGFSIFASGMLCFFRADFAPAMELFEQADQILSHQCVGVWWERSTARTMMAWSLFHMGEISRLAVFHDQTMTDAEQRGDVYATTNLQALISPLLCLVNDESTQAALHVEQALQRWPYQGYHTQHMIALFCRAHLALYENRPQDGWRLLANDWGRLRSTLQLRNQMLRTMFVDVRARTAIAIAAKDPDAQRRWLGRAERDLRGLYGEGTPLAKACAARVAAGISQLKGHRAECQEQLKVAAASFDDLHMKMHAAAARRCLGQMLGGSTGNSLVDQSTQVLRGENVKNLSAWNRMWIAGFPL